MKSSAKLQQIEEENQDAMFIILSDVWLDQIKVCYEKLFEPVHEKTNNLGFRSGPAQTRLYCHSIKLEA